MLNSNLGFLEDLRRSGEVRVFSSDETQEVDNEMYEGMERTEIEYRRMAAISIQDAKETYLVF